MHFLLERVDRREGAGHFEKDSSFYLKTEKKVKFKRSEQR
jgi:hypothetical protein